MAEAKRDQNRVPTLLAVSSTDSITPVVLEADATNKSLLVTIAADDVGIGGGTQYAEDAAHSSGNTGTLALVVRKDTAAQLAGTDGDYTALITDANGRLHVLDQNSAAIKTAVELIDNAISGTEMQVDVVGALPAGTNAIGKLAANSGVDIGDVDILSIAAGDNNIGNVDIASALPAGTNAIGKLAANSGVDIGDVDVTSLPALAAGTNIIGVVDNIPTDYELAGNTLHVKKYYTNAGAVTDGIVWSPAAGKRWYVTDIIINVSAAATVTLEDDLAGGDSAVFKAELAANSGISHAFNTPLFSGEDAADLLVTTSAGNVYITVTGYEV